MGKRVGFYLPEGEFAKVHNYKGNVLMALNASYAFLAASFSDLLTGFAILLANYTASLPLNTGVSLMSRALNIIHTC